MCYECYFLTWNSLTALFPSPGGTFFLISQGILSLHPCEVSCPPPWDPLHTHTTFVTFNCIHFCKWFPTKSRFLAVRHLPYSSTAYSRMPANTMRSEYISYRKMNEWMNEREDEVTKRGLIREEKRVPGLTLGSSNMWVSCSNRLRRIRRVAGREPGQKQESPWEREFTGWQMVGRGQAG